MIFMIDNYDSFTYNLYQYIGSLNPEIQVYRNDRITLAEIEALNPSHIIISPGPGFPSEAGISKAVIKHFGHTTPLLGICLGHQAIGEVYGAAVVHSPSGPIHGKACDVHVASGCPLFNGLPPVIQAGRYHSLAVDAESLPDCLCVTAETTEGILMGVAHRTYPVFGIQFHPESVLTEFGMKIIENFLRIEKVKGAV
ncbi:MAG: aminodeoxychorismate/anthranilate synthase component II [Clostridia bacterium]|nr:aminodeoxychorismate/anthranilate synthase component II [Clostridia bacterium]